MTTPVKPVALRQLWPLLLVQDIERSLAFYRDRLGFTVVDQAESQGKAFWCRVERDGVSLMLQHAEEDDGPAAGRGRGVTFYIVCHDADALFAEFASRGLALAPPQNTYYGMRQLFVPEPDGYVVCFESPI